MRTASERIDSMPHINLIARKNGVGLDQDISLVHDILIDAGYRVTVSHCRSIPAWSRFLPTKSQFDANIFLERVFPRWLPRGAKNFLIPNQERFPKRHLRHLKGIDTVLCKTQHAMEVFSPHARAEFIGFTSTDRSLADQKPDYTSYFHLAGRSTLKGTETILALWNEHPEWPELTLIQSKENAPESVPDNVRLLSGYLSSDDLIREMNRHGTHLCPSRSEGWGHYIVEALSCRALVITTDAPPMNELVQPSTGILVPSHREEERHLGTNFFADPHALAQALENSFRLADKDKSAIGNEGRRWFEQNHEEFTHRLTKTIHSLLD